MQIDLVFLAGIFSGPWLPREKWFSADSPLPNTITKSKDLGTAWVSLAQRMGLGRRRQASCHLVNVPNSPGASRDLQEQGGLRSGRDRAALCC